MNTLYKICTQCKTSFNKPYYCSMAKWSTRHFCSRECHGMSMFGKTPWNKGIKYTSRMKGRLNLRGLKGGQGWNRGIKSPLQDELKPNWKGESVSYSGIHHWVARKLGKPNKCQSCGAVKSRYQMNWANVDHKYRRVLSDWLRLCRRCHYSYDKKLESIKVCH